MQKRVSTKTPSFAQLQKKDVEKTMQKRHSPQPRNAALPQKE
jgi:hypothetical protein